MKKFLVMLAILCSLTLFCGNGVTVEETASADTGYTLQDSVFVSYDAAHDPKTNCYAFALGRRFNIADNKDNESYGDIGCYSVLINQNSGIEECANGVLADLVALGYTNGVKHYTCPNYSSLQPNQKLICLRLSTGNDTHFMLYDPTFVYSDEDGNTIRTGAWLHKPGGSAVLCYKYEDVEETVWTNEFCYANPENATEPTITYNSQIIYFTFYTELNYEVGGYEIKSYNDLLKIHGKQSEYWLLKNSFSIPSNNIWTPIESFSGVLDGQNYTISGLTISGNIQTDTGFIKINNGIIKNLKFSDAEININGNSSLFQPINVGIVAGVNREKIENCQVGQSRIYGEANIMVNRLSNIGGICGLNESEEVLENCIVKYFNALGFGTIGGVAGVNRGSAITNCDVISPTLNLYHGAVGGVVGYNNLMIDGQSIEKILKNCDVVGGTITCYNGYPDIFPEYYVGNYPNNYLPVSSGYNFTINAGGLIGYHDFSGSGSMIKGCSVTSTNLYCNISSELDNTNFPSPEVGVICGRAKSTAFVYTTTTTIVENTAMNYYSGCSVYVGALPIEKQTYIGLRAIGNSNW